MIVQVLSQRSSVAAAVVPELLCGLHGLALNAAAQPADKPAVAVPHAAELPVAASYSSDPNMSDGSLLGSPAAGHVSQSNA